MNVSPINLNTSFCAKLEMSQRYRTRLYSKTDNTCDKKTLSHDINCTLRQIEKSPIKDTYRLENTVDLKRYELRNGHTHTSVMPLNIVYKNDEKVGVYPGREKRFIKKLARSLDLQVKHSDAFEKIGMGESDILRMCNEIPNSSTEELENALCRIENSKKTKKYSFSSEAKNGDIYETRRNVLKNEKGKVVKRKTSSVADFVVLVAKKYFK